MRLVKINQTTWVNPEHVAVVENGPWRPTLVMRDGSRLDAEGDISEVVESLRDNPIE